MKKQNGVPVLDGRGGTVFFPQGLHILHVITAASTSKKEKKEEVQHVHDVIFKRT